MTHKYKTFDDWFFEGEEYAMRAERFYDVLHTMTPDQNVKWLKAAFEAAREDYDNIPKRTNET